MTMLRKQLTKIKSTSQDSGKFLNNFFGLKYKVLAQIRDEKNSDPGWKK